MNEKQLQWIESNLDLHNFQVDQLTVMPGIKWKPRHRKFIRDVRNGCTKHWDFVVVHPSMEVRDGNHRVALLRRYGPPGATVRAAIFGDAEMVRMAVNFLSRVSPVGGEGRGKG